MSVDPLLKASFTRRDFGRALAIGGMFAGLGGASHARDASARRPNIVVILSDDMGYSDIGCYGGEINTPSLDALAANGLRFTQFYNTARCCPTRATLLTGLYAHQAGIGHMTNDRGADGYRGDLNSRCVTIAEALRPAGYGTYAVGKWHVTKYKANDGPKHNWPLQRGFDRYFGTISGAGSFWTPSTLTVDNEIKNEYPDDFYYTDAISDRAAAFIHDHSKTRRDDPFFMYVAYTAAHWPLHARKRDIDRYRGKYMMGWDRLREQRHKQSTELGLVDKKWPLTPRDAKAPAWDSLDDAKQREMDHKMAIYAAQVDSMDQGIGRIVDALRKTGRLDNTLIVYMQDNGACAEGGNLGFERHSFDYAADPDRLGTDRTFASYGLCWANAGNTPFRRYKHHVHEGGIATPLVAHWPTGFKARGELRRQPAHLIDIMATCVDIGGATYPTRFNDVEIQPMEGRSLAGAFAGDVIDREAIYWEHEGNRALRVGDWKLVASGATGPWELYDLAADRTELNDLAAEQPERAKRMAAMWEAWGKRANAWPPPMKAKKPAKKKTATGKVANAKLVFDLKQGERLTEDDAPQIGGRSLTIAATIDAAKPDGVILSQGGTRLGYALYVAKGRLYFVVRNNAKTYEVVSPASLPSDTSNVGARLTDDGALTLTINGKTVATGKALGPISDRPTEGLSVGFDDAKAVGSYELPATFNGKITSLRLTLGK